MDTSRKGRGNVGKVPKKLSLKQIDWIFRGIYDGRPDNGQVLGGVPVDDGDKDKDDDRR